MFETLEGVPGDRKCYRMIGGVLVERTVKEVAPALTSNRDKVIKGLTYFSIAYTSSFLYYY